MANGHGARGPRPGGGGNPPQSRTAVALVPTRIDATAREIDVRVTVTRGGAALAAGSVIFSRGANPELDGLVALASDGTAAWTYKNIPNVDSATLKVEMADGSGYREITVAIPAKPASATSARLKIEPTDEVIESMSNKFNIDIITLDTAGKVPTTAMVRFSADNPVNLIDRATSANIATRVTSFNLNITSGVLDLQMVPVGPDKLERKVRFMLDGTTDTIRKHLRFR